MPLSGPAIATVAILTFLPAWNSYLWPLMVVQSEDLRPVMVGIQYFFQLNVAWGQIMAYSSMITVPVLALVRRVPARLRQQHRRQRRQGLMLALPDSWVWDFWFADDGDEYHLFFLYASRALHDPDRRHGRASIGHAVSDDLRNWTRLPDALVRGESGRLRRHSHLDRFRRTGADGQWFMYLHRCT